nr:MAG TPA: hypothetical protein [Caudoviricetes sp.]
MQIVKIQNPFNLAQSEVFYCVLKTTGYAGSSNKLTAMHIKIPLL